MANNSRQIFRTTAKIFWGIIWGIFTILLIIVGWLSFDKFVLKSPIPSMLGYASLTIETGSMNGYSAMVQGDDPKQVSIGDIIIIKKTNDYVIGDVITFLPEGDKIPTTHRIIGYSENGYITKGDANNVEDTLPIEKDKVIGEVVLHMPKFGKFIVWVKQDGWLYLASILAIFAIGSFLTSATKEEN